MPRVSCSEVHTIVDHEMGNPDSDEDSEKAMATARAAAPPSAMKRRKGLCFKVTITVFPLVVWLVYLTGGAFMFSGIEGPNLARIRAKEKEQYSELLFEAWERGRNCNMSNVTYEMMGDNNVTACQIADLVDLIIGEVHQDKGIEWDFLGGFHFCLTVVSTIGYGILVPKTQLGRFLCILYAVIGIPLNIALIGFVGRGIVHVITIMYESLFNLCQSCKVKRTRHVDVRPPRSVSCISVISAARVKHASKQDNCRRSVASTNIEGGDVDFSKDGIASSAGGDGHTRLNGIANPTFLKKQNGKLGSLSPSRERKGWGGGNLDVDAPSSRESITHSIQMCDIYNGNVHQGEGTAMVEVGNDDVAPTIQPRDRENSNSSSNNENNNNKGNNKSDNSDGEDNNDDRKPKSVPIWFVCLFFIVYLCLTSMAIYYSSFVPDEWTLLDSFYFDIVTILTVGFGDMFYYNRGETLGQSQKTTAGLLSITMMILGMLMLSAFLSFAVESLTLDNMKKAFDYIFVSCWERCFRRKRKRKKPDSAD